MNDEKICKNCEGWAIYAEEAENAWEGFCDYNEESEKSRDCDGNKECDIEKFKSNQK